MAAVEAPQSRSARPAISLLIVLAIAKTLMLVGRPVPVSVWTPFVYFWQDVAVALLFGLAASLIRRPALVWSIYAAITAYVALNVPISHEVSSTLTPAMIRGAGGAIADSIGGAFTPVNLTRIAVVLATGFVAPILLRRVSLRARPVLWTVAALAWIVIGLSATSRLDTLGRHRNALATLLPPTIPAAASGSAPVDWRASPFPAGASSSLKAFSGSVGKQNVILISLESTAARYLRTYGAREDPMPNLTRLASRGIVVDDAYAVYPESIKGLFSTLCSRFPAYDTPVEAHAESLCTSLAQQLKDHGYRTALLHSGRFGYLGMEGIIANRGFDVLHDAGAIGGQVDSSFGIDEASTVRHLLGWVDSLGTNDRFFVTYLPIAGHHPYATSSPGPFSNGTDLGQYLNALHEGDAALGQLLDGLAARHRDKNTLIVIFGDHGEAFLQHDGNVAHTQFIFDENVRVPLVIVPGQASASSSGWAGSRVPRVASLIDIAPTVLDLLGFPVPKEYQGASIFSPEPRMALFFTDYALGWLGLRDGCWKYQFQVDAARSTLFDVCTDPDEKIDRAREQQARVAAYRERLEQWSSAQRIAVRRKN